MTSTSHQVGGDLTLPGQLCDEIDAFASQHESAWVAYRRERHCSPEPSGEERETSHSICERLRSLGIEAKIPDRGVGVVGNFHSAANSRGRRTLAIRADIDALRMQDEKDVGYASIKSGVAHSCGHDVHTTVVLGTAELLTYLQHQGHDLPDTGIRLLFQAAEETCEGAAWMVEDGALQDVESILGIHVEPNLRVGEVGIRYGVFTAQVDEVQIHIKGCGGHTARPHSTTDPIHAAALLISTLYQQLPRSVDVRDASVFTIGQMQGGFASNVIPNDVQLRGTLRTTDSPSRDSLMKTIESTCGHIGALTGNHIDVRFCLPLGSVVNAQHETAAFEAAVRQALGDGGVAMLDRPSMGGEDFAVYMNQCSGSQIRLGCATQLPWPHLHSPVFDVDERAIGIGVRVLARAALMRAFQMDAESG